MDSLFASLLPFILGSALVPIQVIITILLLKSPQNGLLKASFFVAGMTSLRLLQGLFFGLILTGSAAVEDSGSGKGLIVSTLLMILGILLLVTAYKQLQKEDDPDAPPPKWLAGIDSLTPFKAFGIGFGMLFIGAKFWVFTLGAIGVIGEAQLGQPASTIDFLLYVLLAESLLVLILLIRVMLPKRSKSVLESISAWLIGYNRQIIMIVSLVFGLLFFYQGVSGLLG